MIVYPNIIALLTSKVELIKWALIKHPRTCVCVCVELSNFQWKATFIWKLSPEPVKPNWQNWIDRPAKYPNSDCRQNPPGLSSACQKTDPTGWLTNKLTECLTNWLTDWLPDWLTGWMTNSRTEWVLKAMANISIKLGLSFLSALLVAVVVAMSSVSPPALFPFSIFHFLGPLCALRGIR